MPDPVATPGRICVGIGGWTFEPWRGSFYPRDLPQKRELEYASRQVTAIEINGTYYRAQKPESYAKWRDDTPDDFVFSVKAPRYATNRAILAEARSSVERFVEGGVLDLREKLGPLLWQFAPTKHYEPEDFERFLQLLPRDAGGMPLRHVLDVRHTSFMCAGFLTLARRYGAATVFTDSADYPSFADLTSDFVYARLMRSEATVETGYRPDALKQWAARARTWARGSEPDDLPRAEPQAEQKAKLRDVFVFMINGAKERAPAAARALLEYLKE